MPTAARAAYGTQLRLGTSPGPVLSVIGASNATPIVITLATPHGIPVGDVSWVEVLGVPGNTAANGLWVVDAQTTTHLKLRGSVGNGASPGGGTLQTRSTFFIVVELVNITPIGISFNMVDASAHDGSGWGTSIPTFKRGVDMRVEINLVPGNSTHDAISGILALALGKFRRPWLIVLPDPGKTVVAFEAWVSDHGTVTPFDNVLRSTPVLSIDGKMDWTYA
jgi:hypothetical protein